METPILEYYVLRSVDGFETWLSCNFRSWTDHFREAQAFSTARAAYDAGVKANRGSLETRGAMYVLALLVFQDRKS